MSADRLVNRARLFLLWLAFALSGGVVAELVLTEHYQEWRQWIPLILSGAALFSIVSVLGWPRSKTIWGLRWLMVVTTVGSIFGIYEHLEGNLAFAQEINASAANAAPLLTALTGANPPLAPGALAVTALVALAATYYHPSLQSK